LIGFWVASYVGDKYKDLKATDLAAFWNHTWVVPAIIAAVVFFIFLALFKDEKVDNAKAAH